MAFPAYVTDGSHVYIWHPEYERLLGEGKLKECPAPVPKGKRAMSARKQAKLEEARKKALKDAQDAVELFSAPLGKEKFEEVFGAMPKDDEPPKDLD